MQNEYLATAYDEIDQRVAERLRTCATRLIYGIGEDGKRRLRAANFCRVRLCPICQWRRSSCTVRCRRLCAMYPARARMRMRF